MDVDVDASPRSGGRRTIALVAAWLLLSHGLAWWLGMSGRDEEKGEHRTPNIEHRISNGGEREATSAEWLRRGQEHRAEVEAMQKRGEAAAQLSWRERVAAARQKISADADFIAMVKKGVAGVPEEDGASIDPETAAAFGIWMEKDPLVALNFIGRLERESLLDRFTHEVADWMLRTGTFWSPETLLVNAPPAATLLLEALAEVANTRGDNVLAMMMMGLSMPEDKMGLLEAGLQKEALKGNLMITVGQLGGYEDRVLMELLGRADPDFTLADEVRAAGFAPALLAQYEEKLAQYQPPVEETPGNADSYLFSNMEPQGEQMPPGQLLAGLAKIAAGFPDNNWEVSIDQIPALSEACEDARYGRIPVAELLPFVLKEYPDAVGQEEGVRRLIFQHVFQARPAETLRWYRDAGGDWQGAFAEHVLRLTPEQMLAVGTELPELAPTVANRPGDFLEWYRVSPQSCLQALQRYPHEKLREEVMAHIKEQEERQ